MNETGATVNRDHGLSSHQTIGNKAKIGESDTMFHSNIDNRDSLLRGSMGSGMGNLGVSDTLRGTDASQNRSNYEALEDKEKQLYLLQEEKMRLEQELANLRVFFCFLKIFLGETIKHYWKR